MTLVIVESWIGLMANAKKCVTYDGPAGLAWRPKSDFVIPWGCRWNIPIHRGGTSRSIGVRVLLGALCRMKASFTDKCRAGNFRRGVVLGKRTLIY